jgi:hypothetical protein
MRIHGIVLAGIATLVLAENGLPQAELFAVNNAGSGGGNFLATVDPNTGQVTVLGPTAFTPVGLTCSPAGELFTWDALLGNLVVLDSNSGATARVVGSPGSVVLSGLAFRPTDGRLYALDSTNADLVVLDPATASIVETVGSYGSVPMSALSWSPDGSALYAVDLGTGGLYSLDPVTAMPTLIGLGAAGNAGGPLGLAADPSQGTLYVAEWRAGADMTLATVSTSNGVRSAVGTMVGATQVGGMAFGVSGYVIGTYCTAGTSASGCSVGLQGSGTPSATAPSGFVLHAGGVEGGKDGIFFFGTNGRLASPWGNGSSYRCVAAPVKRTGLLTGTGTGGACNGVLDQDLNAHWTARPSHNPGVGATVQAQLWYRDPFNTSNQTTSLSDALEFFVQP